MLLVVLLVLLPVLLLVVLLVAGRTGFGAPLGSRTFCPAFVGDPLGWLPDRLTLLVAPVVGLNLLGLPAARALLLEFPAVGALLLTVELSGVLMVRGGGLSGVLMVIPSPV